MVTLAAPLGIWRGGWPSGLSPLPEEPCHRSRKRPCGDGVEIAVVGVPHGLSPPFGSRQGLQPTIFGVGRRATRSRGRALAVAVTVAVRRDVIPSWNLRPGSNGEPCRHQITRWAVGRGRPCRSCRRCRSFLRPPPRAVSCTGTRRCGCVESCAPRVPNVPTVRHDDALPRVPRFTRGLYATMPRSRCPAAALRPWVRWWRLRALRGAMRPIRSFTTTSLGATRRSARSRQPGCTRPNSRSAPPIARP